MEQHPHSGMQSELDFGYSVSTKPVDQNFSHNHENFDNYEHDVLRHERIIGIESQFNTNLVWNEQYNYYAFTCGSRVIVNYFNENQDQQILRTNF